jgi:amino acid adenylation domain-containing protein
MISTDQMFASEAHLCDRAELCIHEWFEIQAERNPNFVALLYEDRQLTYRDLNTRANQLAHRLRRLGVGPDVLVGVFMERSFEMVIALFSILKAGGAYVPLDPDYPCDRLSFMLTDAQLPLLLTQKHLLDSLPDERPANVIALDDERAGLDTESIQNPVTIVSEQNLAYCIYTSGSTGRPKGTLNTHAGISNRLCWMQETYNLTVADRVLQKTTFNFDVSVWEFFWPLMTGAGLVVARPGGHRDGSYMVQLIREHGITTMHFTPSMLRTFLKEPEVERCTSLKRMICSGEALTFDVQQLFFEKLPAAELHNLYGPTEAAVDVTWWQCEKDSTSPVVPIGKPIANTDIYILDPQFSPVPDGVDGELYIGGIQLARGYLNRADLTAEKFIPDAFGPRGARLYRTGDLARYRSDGNIEYLGRIDHQIKLRGIRIELGEIEAVLSTHPQIQQTVVVAQKNGPDDRRLVAYVVTEQNGSNDMAAKLRQHLREKLPEHMLPAAYVTLASLPHLPNGKVDRKSLPEFDFSECEVEYVAPRSKIEETLTEIWSEVLERNRVGVHDDFLYLGGHSLLATMIITRVRQLLEVELPQRVLFDAPTIAQLAQIVEETKRSAQQPEASVVSEPAKTLNELSASERAALVMRFKKKPAETTPDETIPRRKDSGPVPLSFAQQRLWFLEQLGDSNYLVPATSRLTGPLDVAALERSINEIVARHDALRSTFTTIDGQPMQIIAPQLPLTLAAIDLRHLPDSERAVETRRLREEALRPFNLERGPLFRASLLRVADEEHLLLLTMHHIVSDGWSLGVLIRELATLYENFVEGTTPNLPELPIQYADFAVWQRQWLSGEVIDQQLQYWREHLGDNPPVLELPTDRPRPLVPTYKGSFLTCEISQQLTDALKDLSRREGVSLYMTLLAAFKTLLARYAGQDHVIVGTPIANRNRMDIENLIGFFVNTLVLRTDVSDNPRFHKFLKQIREVTLGAFAHQDVPFEKLVEELQPERDMTRTPLFQVMFSLQNSPMPALKLSQVTMTLLQDESTTSAFDLTLDITERSQGLDCLLEYSTEIFDRSTAQRILNHFTNLLESIVANPHQRLRELPLLTADEKQQILVDWNNTASEHDRYSCVHRLFEAQAERTPEAVALIFGDQRVTYAELNERANRLGHYLKERGVGPETRVGILLDRSVEMAVALLAILKAGGAYVAFDPAYPPDRLRYMFEDSGVALILTEQQVMANHPEIGVRSILIDEIRTSQEGWLAPAAASDSQNVESDTHPENIVYLVYTSGSTGRPKGIVIEHRSLVNAAYAFINKHRMTERDRLLQFASLSFDVAAEEFFSSWLSGGCIVMKPETVMSHTEFVSLIDKDEITIVNLPASFWLEWLTAISEKNLELPNTLRRVIVGNEKTLEETLAKWQRLMGQKVEWCNAYGPSETTITASNYEPAGTNSAREEKSTVPIGRPVINVEMYVLDPAQQLVPTGVAGELYIGGAGLARGYHNQPDQTAERFIPHPFSSQPGERLYRTGDLARFRADGNVEFLGRVDEQVKIRGFRIEVGEVETVLAQHAGVRESVVIAREDERGSNRLIAYVVANNGDLQAAELRSYLKERLAEYMVPSSFVVLDALPRTPNGKVDRRALPNADVALADDREVYIAPRSAMETAITNIWQELLKVEKVGVNDNFFGLGGHSLLLVHAQSKVTEALRVKLSMVEMFKYPTVSALAEHLSQQHSSVPTAAPVRNQAESRIEALNRQRQLRQRATRRS